MTHRDTILFYLRKQLREISSVLEVSGKLLATKEFSDIKTECEKLRDAILHIETKEIL